MRTAVECAGLTRRFGPVWALRGVDVRVGAGAVAALLGRNGAGKTTLLRVFSTLLGPTGGRLAVLGHTVMEAGARGRPNRLAAEAARERIAWLSSSGHHYEDLTGLENLAFFSRLAGGGTDAAWLRDLLDRVGIARAANFKVRTFSAGMRRRLDLARLCAAPADLVLMDEPFVNLDADGASLVRELIREWKAGGAAVIVATHLEKELASVADLAVRLRAGRPDLSAAGDHLPAQADP